MLSFRVERSGIEESSQLDSVGKQNEATAYRIVVRRSLHALSLGRDDKLLYMLSFLYIDRYCLAP